MNINFENFGQSEAGRVVTAPRDGRYAAVWAGNPYGGHNLVFVRRIEGGDPFYPVSFHHGNVATLAACRTFGDRRMWRRIAKFLLKEKGADWLRAHQDVQMGDPYAE